MVNKLSEYPARFPSVLYLDVYPYFISENGEVQLLIFKRRSDVLLPETWQCVSGKLKKNETIRDGFMRQTFNKTGQIPKRLHKIDYINTFYDSSYDTVFLVPSAGAAIQKENIQIDFSLHTEFKWVDIYIAKEFLTWRNQIECIDLLAKSVANNDFIPYSLLDN